MTTVPDGDPCPRHGLESRLLMGANGPFSQCATCRVEFLEWYGSHARDVRPVKELPDYSQNPVENQEHPGVPAWRARQLAAPSPKPEPAQFELGVSL